VEDINKYPSLAIHNEPFKTYEVIVKAVNNSDKLINATLKNTKVASYTLNTTTYFVEEPKVFYGSSFKVERMFKDESMLQEFIKSDTISKFKLQKYHLLQYNGENISNLQVTYDLKDVMMKIFPMSKIIKSYRTKDELDNDFWQPSSEIETQKALNKIYEFLKHNSSKSKKISNIHKNWHKYKVQFFGLKKDEKKLIYCNFVPVDDNFPNWEKDEAIMDDGGFWYWQIEYDMKNNKAQNFKCNGEG